MPKPRRKFPLLVLVGRSTELARLAQALHDVDGAPGVFAMPTSRAAEAYLLRRAGESRQVPGPLPLMVILDDELEGGEELLRGLQDHPQLRYVVPLLLTRSPREFRLRRPALTMPKPGSEADCEKLARKVRGLLPDKALH